MGEVSFKIMLVVFNVIFIAFIAGIVIFIREYRIKKRNHKEQLQKTNLLHKKELLKTRVEIQMQSMKRIGREIHDNVGQKLTLSSLYVQQLIYENKAPQILDSLQNVNTIIDESLEELRQLSKSLTDNSIEKNTIDDLLKEECLKIEQLQKCKVLFSSDHKAQTISYQTKIVLVRITQEFLQNSLKHSQCKNIEVKLSSIQNTLNLLLKDNGTGFDTENIKTNGIGLKNMQRRVEMIDGVFVLESNKNIGTRLTIEIPF